MDGARKMPEIALDVEKVSVYTRDLVGPFCSLLSMLLINNLYFFLSLFCLLKSSLSLPSPQNLLLVKLFWQMRSLYGIVVIVHLQTCLYQRKQTSTFKGGKLFTMAFEMAENPEASKKPGSLACLQGSPQS